jgi:hypothetical protein
MAGPKYTMKLKNTVTIRSRLPDLHIDLVSIYR